MFNLNFILNYGTLDQKKVNRELTDPNLFTCNVSEYCVNAGITFKIYVLKL